MAKRHPKKTIAVSFHQPAGQYRKYVGKSVGRDGSLRPKCWYLGEDEREAVSHAVELTAECYWGDGALVFVELDRSTFDWGVMHAGTARTKLQVRCSKQLSLPNRSRRNIPHTALRIVVDTPSD